MSAKEVGEKMVAFCKKGANLDSINTLYHDEVESIEAAEAPGMERHTKGIDGVRKKNQWWMDNHEVHESEIEGPFPHGDDRFCVIFRYDVTHKPSSERWKMEEVGLFTLKDDKVIKEEFFYAMG